MNDHDWLKEAAGALRDEHQGAPAPGVDTRARVLATLHQHERQRRRWISVLVPLAAVFVFSSAWAASTGRMSQVFSLLPLPFAPAPIPTLSVVPASTLSTGPARPVASALDTASLASAAPPVLNAEVVPTVPPQASSAAEPPAPATAVVAVVPPSSGLAPASVPSVGTTSTAATSTAAPPVAVAATNPAVTPNPASAVATADAKTPGTSEEDRLYREAHQAHFVERNPARALAAWDAYLRAQKTGRFATEAVYNRALSLLRLGRTAEARKALEPFAEGRYGSYRKEEARKLIDAL